MNEPINYNDAVQIIKTAILQSQYRAAKATNAEQLSLYYAVGGYVSANTRTGKWGTGAVDAISEQLQKELPGLRGFSARNLKYMRTFYEEWAHDLQAQKPIRHLQMPKSSVRILWQFGTCKCRIGRRSMSRLS